MTAYLPQSGGILPYWLLLTSVASIYNAAQNYFSSWQTKEIYSLKAHEVTPLAARCFAAWTATAGVIRLLAAYNLSDPTIYTLAQSTYAIALGHFGSEWLLFRTIRLNRASAGPFVVATVSLIWTFSQRGFYVR